MTHQQTILSVINGMHGTICDDCLVPAAGLKQRQTAYSVCSQLAGEKHISRQRGECSVCHKSKIVNWRNGMVPSAPPPVSTVVDTAIADSHAADEKARRAAAYWYWEGNVQAGLITWLAQHGYVIYSAADTAARSPGKDIVAVGPDRCELWVSVKGYPAPGKSCHPQARHWFAQAIFDLVLYREQNPTVRLAIALPDGFQTYLSLAPRVAWLKAAMPFTIFWVAESGAVREE